MTTPRCVVSLATNHNQYPASLTRLGESLRRVGFADEFICWGPGSFPLSAPSHLDVPFAFKPHYFAEVRRRGGSHLLWLDSSCIAVRALDPIFEQIEQDGYILFRNGRYRLGEWTSDEALSALGLDREEAMEIPEVNGGAIGLSTDSEVGATFLERWHRAAQREVAFRGITRRLRTDDDYQDVKWNRGGRVSADPRVRGHRHDQTVAGVIAAQLGMRLSADGLEIYSRMKRVIRPTTRILIDRDAARPHVRLATLGRVRRAAQLGKLMAALRSSRRQLK